MIVSSTTGDYYDIIGEVNASDQVVFNREPIFHQFGKVHDIKEFVSTKTVLNTINENRKSRQLQYIANPKLLICGYVHNDIMTEYSDTFSDDVCVSYARIMDDYTFDSIYKQNPNVSRVMYSEKALSINKQYEQPIILMKERIPNNYKPITDHIILLGRIRGFQKAFSAKSIHTLIHNFIKTEL